MLKPTFDNLLETFQSIHVVQSFALWLAEKMNDENEALRIYKDFIQWRNELTQHA